MNTPTNSSKNVLNSDVEVKGTLKFSGELTFDGKLDGDIQSEGSLNLGDNAVVKGNLNVNTVVMRGKVNGIDVDRKSTRLNSSHLAISYAVFCLKKKRSLPTSSNA